jgi:hypothetical protein
MNATYLFEKPYREFHNSESWWSSFFSLFLLSETQSKAPRSIPVWRYAHPNRFWRSGTFETTNITFSNIVVEGALCGHPFSLSAWPPEYARIKIDLALIRDRLITLIETKTIGASIARNLLLYGHIANHLTSQGWQTSLYYLISYGHESRNDADWKLISQQELPLFLWEDVFRLASSTALGRSLGVNLDEYTDLPIDVGEPKPT